MTTIKKTVFVAVCLSLALALALCGCSSKKDEEKAQQEANQAYMASVNQKMEDLQTRLDSFNDAVSRDDLVSMKTQADNAFACLDELEKIEAPKALQDVHKGYVEGSKLLRQALTDYVDLYTEIESADDSSQFDYSTYDARISDIKATYDKGIAELQAADSAAAELK